MIQILVNYYTIDIISKTGKNDKLKNLIMYCLWKFQISKNVGQLKTKRDFMTQSSISIDVKKLTDICNCARPMRPNEVDKLVNDLILFSTQVFKVYHGKTYEDLLRIKSIKLILNVKYDKETLEIQFDKRMLELTEDKNVSKENQGYNKGTYLFKFIDYEIIQKLTPKELIVYLHIFLNHKYYKNLDKHKNSCNIAWEKLRKIMNISTDKDLKKNLVRIIEHINKKLGLNIQLAKSESGIKIGFRYFKVDKLVGGIKETKSKVENKQKVENEDVENYITTYTDIFNEKPLETVNKKKIESMIETIKELNKLNDFNKKVSENIEGIIELMNRYKKAFFDKDSDFRFSLIWTEKQKEKVLTRLMLNKGSWKGEIKAGEVDKDKFDKLNDDTPLADDEVEVF